MHPTKVKKYMKFTCANPNCQIGRDFDETELTQFLESINTEYHESYLESRLCPECYLKNHTVSIGISDTISKPSPHIFLD